MNADFVYLLLKSTKVPKMCHDDKTIKLLIFRKNQNCKSNEEDGQFRWSDCYQ